MIPDSLFEVLRKPLLDNQNAVITFEVETGIDDGVDDDGNSIVLTETITLNAIIHPLNTQDSYFEGGDRKVLKVRGRLTDPLSFPNTIKHLSKGEATIDGKMGDFILHLTTQNPYVGNKLGVKFEGVFNEY